MATIKPYIHAHNYIITRRVVYSKKRLQLTTEGFLCNLYANFRAIWHRQRTNPGILVLYRGVKVHWHLANRAFIIRGDY